jgi:hypothetical protein
MKPEPPAFCEVEGGLRHTLFILWWVLGSATVVSAEICAYNVGSSCRRNTGPLLSGSFVVVSFKWEGITLCGSFERASNLMGVLHVVAKMATICKTSLISLKSRFCKDAVITKNLPQLLVQLSNIALKTGCKSCYITYQLGLVFTKHGRCEPSTSSFANTTLQHSSLRPSGHIPLGIKDNSDS